jgi:hypothetical protein
MSAHAEVRSLAQLQNLRERCTHSRVQTLRLIERLRSEMQKLTRWLDDEALPYWQRELTLAERSWNECREVLMRCQATVRSDEQRPCTEERKRLERATRRRELCDAKLRSAREARLAWQKQVVKLSGRMQNAADVAESELLATVHQLDNIIGTLQAYAQVQSGQTAPAVADARATAQRPNPPSSDQPSGSDQSPAN